MAAQFSVHAPVLVWGGGSGGVAAALQAARAGAETLLLTPGPWLGGMVSAAGVCCPDGNELSPWQTGLWGALLRALAAAEPEGLDHNWVSCFGYRPATAERILRGWVQAEARLQWWSDCTVLAVQRQGDRIRRLTVRRGTSADGPEEAWGEVGVDLVIDGSDRGDLLPLLESPFRLGWESREQWGEPSAPPQAELDANSFFQRQPVQSPTWVVLAQLRGDPGRPMAEPPDREPPDCPPPAGGIPGGQPGRKPAPPPLPEPFRGACDAFGLERTLHYGRLPGGLVMLNWPLHGNDWHEELGRALGNGPATAFPAPGAEQELATAMRTHSLNFAQALAEASGGALALAEVFPDPAAARAGALAGREALALMPYWREGRRLVGREVVVEQQLLPTGPGASIAPLPRDGQGRCTAIAVGNYANDHHYPGPDWPLAPKSCRWGGRWSGTPFTIPYGALVSGAIANLLAADKAISVSHMANGATRLQPLVLNLGQAAGLAAALCLQRGEDPAELPVALLQEALIRDPLAPAGPFPLWDLPWHHPRWAEAQLRVLERPEQLDGQGRLLAAEAALQAADPGQAPPEPGEALWQGEVRPDGHGGYGLATDRGCWPLITLEPGLHRWLAGLETPRPARLIGCANPWGPWLRVSRLAPP
jgi:hypothetical protein